MKKTKTEKKCELAIFYGNDNELIETYEYDTLEILTDELKDVLVHYKNYTKIEKYNFFNEFLKRHYNVEEKNEKFYIFNENSRIRSCQKHLVIYENDKVSLEDLYNQIQDGTVKELAHYISFKC